MAFPRAGDGCTLHRTGKECTSPAGRPTHGPCRGPVRGARRDRDGEIMERRDLSAATGPGRPGVVSRAYGRGQGCRAPAPRRR